MSDYLTYPQAQDPQELMRIDDLIKAKRIEIKDLQKEKNMHGITPKRLTQIDESISRKQAELTRIQDERRFVGGQGYERL
jgi:hypothetical protein